MPPHLGKQAVQTLHDSGSQNHAALGFRPYPGSELKGSNGFKGE